MLLRPLWAAAGEAQSTPHRDLSHRAWHRQPAGPMVCALEVKVGNTTVPRSFPASFIHAHCLTRFGLADADADPDMSACLLAFAGIELVAVAPILLGCARALGAIAPATGRIHEAPMAGPPRRRRSACSVHWEAAVAWLQDGMGFRSRVPAGAMASTGAGANCGAMVATAVDVSGRESDRPDGRFSAHIGGLTAGRHAAAACTAADMWSQGLATWRARELGGEAWRSGEWSAAIGRALVGCWSAPSARLMLFLDGRSTARPRRASLVSVY